jgi:hypothetical protein
LHEDPHGRRCVFLQSALSRPLTTLTPWTAWWSPPRPSCWRWLSRLRRPCQLAASVSITNCIDSPSTYKYTSSK